MGELRFSMYFKWQIGFAIQLEYGHLLKVTIPFIDIFVSFSKYAKGFEIFGWYR